MQPVNNPWGWSQLNWNQNPSYTSDAFVNDVFGAAHNYSTSSSYCNEEFSSHQQTNPWLPTLWNDNNYDPRHRANPWNQALPSPQSFQSRGPPLPAIQVLRKDWISLSIPTSVAAVDPHFQKFKELCWKFLLEPHNPSQVFDSLVKELIMCSKITYYITRIRNFIHANLGSNPNLVLKEYVRMAPHERMRIFWLLGEIFRPEYDACFDAVRQIFRAGDMFQEFLTKIQVGMNYLEEFQVIWCYWKKYVPKKVTDQIASSCLQLKYKDIMNYAPDQSTCELFYNKTLGYNEYLIHLPTTYVNIVNASPQYVPIAFDCESHYYDETDEESDPDQSTAVSMPVVNESNETGHIQRNEETVVRRVRFSPEPVRYTKSPEPFEFTEKIRKVTSLLEKLVTVDCSDVPKTVLDLLRCFLEHGKDHKLSDQIIRETENVLNEAKNSKIIRILWVIGYLFLPKHESKITALKPLLEKIAAPLFWNCLLRTHMDNSSRQEMRIILKFWCEIVNDEITSSITIRIRDATVSDRNTNMAWILQDKTIRKGTRMSHFYKKYLLKSDTNDRDKIKDPGLGSEAEKNHEQFIPDKCDVIQETSKQKNWEDKLAVQHKSDETLHSRRKLKKPKTGSEGHSDKIFTKFHQVSSKPVNLVKPLLQPTVTTFNSSATNNGSDSVNQQQSGELSKLELFRKMMENDQAIKTIGGGHKWNDASLRENKEIYLRQEWSVDEFVYYVCSDEFQTSWDIVKLKSGEVKVKIMTK